MSNSHILITIMGTYYILYKQIGFIKKEHTHTHTNCVPIKLSAMQITNLTDYV